MTFRGGSRSHEVLFRRSTLREGEFEGRPGLDEARFTKLLEEASEMADQLRANTGKLELGYWMAMRAQEWHGMGADDFRLGDVKALENALGVFVRDEDNVYYLLSALWGVLGGHDAVAEAFCTACMMGAKKYERGNFMLGAPLSQYIDCASRHLKAIRLTGAEYSETFKALNGEQVTQQLNHWHNVAWNVVMIYEVMRAAPQRDDRLFHLGDFTGRDISDEESFADNGEASEQLLSYAALEAKAREMVEADADYDCCCDSTCLRCK